MNTLDSWMGTIDDLKKANLLNVDEWKRDCISYLLPLHVPLDLLPELDEEMLAALRCYEFYSGDSFDPGIDIEALRAEEARGDFSL